MNILLTGGAGFIGRHLMTALLARKHKVVILSRRARVDEGLAGQVRVINGDITDPSLADSLPRDIDVVYHLAAMSLPGPSIDDPRSCWATNTTGTQYLLEASRQRHVKRFVFVSSVYVYGDVAVYPSAETLRPNPMNPLGASKLAAEYLAHAYHQCYDLPVTIFRPFTVYGPGSQENQFIPSLMRQISEGQRLSLGDPRSTRDFVYVGDVVSGLLCGLGDIGGFDIFNLATGTETSVVKLVDTLFDVCGVATREVGYRERPPRADERRQVSRQCADISKARARLGWQPKTSLSEGLGSMWREYKEARHVRTQITD